MYYKIAGYMISAEGCLEIIKDLDGFNITSSFIPMRN